MKIDDPLHLRVHGGKLGSKRCRGVMVDHHGAGGGGIPGELIGKPHPSEAGGAIPEEVATGGVLKIEGAHGDFSKNLMRGVQEARC